MSNYFGNLDTKELDLPDTVFVRDIENRVFQSIVIESLSRVKGVAPVGGSFFDHLLGRDHLEGVKGVQVEQDSKNHSVSVRVEINISYDVPIPAKTEEVQNKIVEDVSRLTGLHVSCVHVIVKNLISSKALAQLETDAGSVKK